MDFTYARHRMVETQIARRGVRDAKVLAAMTVVPREAFVEPDLEEYAYEDRALAIGEGQSISQPYIVAAMIEAAGLGAGDRALEVGAGSGYAAAVLSLIAARVFAIERHAALTAEASKRCRDLGYDNILFCTGDGSLGWPEEAPFDAILVAAGGPAPPVSLKRQLAIGGRLIVPIGDALEQRLLRLTRIGAQNFRKDDLGGVRFVPLIGEQGWPEGPPGASRHTG